jgi:hexosaminidase
MIITNEKAFLMKLNLIKFAVTFLIIISFITARAFNYYLIPEPFSQKQAPGNFELSEKTVIYCGTETSKRDAEIFNEYMMQYYGFKLKIEPVSSFKKGNCIWLEPDVTKSLPPEGYSLAIGAEEIRIQGDASGIFYALQTIKQLLPITKQKKLELPLYKITDHPRYSWRGMHLDVSRHFFPKEFIKKYIDFLAMYKMNTFHWHLTDDQGWRIEIKKYPKLTEIGGYRNGTLIGSYKTTPHQFDTTRYGGFYTQADIKEIVAYAADRHVTIVPEIEMPGHALAALTAYPQFSCTGGPFEVQKLWGVFDDVFCPKEESFKFLEDVLTEVMELFPGKYIHIGGDEVPKERWKKCPHCQSLIKKEGLKDEAELQSYFIKRIEKFVNSKGRNIIGWDEILEGGLAPNAAVMSWRGIEGGIAAAKQKHYVVMSPGGYCYFDHYQGNPKFEPLAIGGYTSVEKVYSYEPTPSELTEAEQKYILGAQANLWTEYIGSTSQIEYMIFPRICALAEVLWSPKDVRNWDNFKSRLIEHFGYLEMIKVNYSKALFELKMKVEKTTTGNGLSVSLESNFPEPQIYFTTDGSEPTTSSNTYGNQIIITKSTLLKTALFQDNIRKGNLFEQQFNVNKATGKKISLTNPPHQNYSTGGAFTLVDGITGVIPWYGKEWLGFSGKDLEAVIDLGKSESITKVTVDVLADENSWIHLPKSIKVLVSADGINYKEMKSLKQEEIVKMKRAMIMEFEKTAARYIKVIAENAGKIPEGMPGAGEPAWLFVDEIVVE